MPAIEKYDDNGDRAAERGVDIFNSWVGGSFKLNHVATWMSGTPGKTKQNEYKNSDRRPRFIKRKLDLQCKMSWRERNRE